MKNHFWKESLQEFFTSRALELPHEIDLEALCYVSGRDPRLWNDDNLYEELINDIVHSLNIDETSDLLEVGCAAGFIANGISSCAKKYVGVDLSKDALKVAKRLRLTNASFEMADGSKLPFENDSFDGAFCYDVVTNFPSFTHIESIITEMLRVVRPGGKVLIGSIPNSATRVEFENAVADVSAQLVDNEVKPRTYQPKGLNRLNLWLRERYKKSRAEIVCYYFSRSDFEQYAISNGIVLELCDIHMNNPYRGFRFNAVFQK